MRNAWDVSGPRATGRNDVTADGIFVPTGSGNLLRPSSVGRAASAAGLGLRRASTPRLMKTADNIGRAIRRINMGQEFPGPAGRKP